LYADENPYMSKPDWKTLLDAGIQAVRQQSPIRALQCLNEAFSLAPTERMVRYWLGNASRLSGDTSRAEQLFDGLLEEHEGDANTAFAKAFLQREQGRSGDAATTLLRLVKALPQDLETQLKVAGFLRDINHFEEAISICQQAVALSPQRADIRIKLARLYLATGDFDNALPRLRQALDVDGSFGGAWLSLSQLQRFKSMEDRDFLALENASRSEPAREAEMCIAFALGKANDDLGRWPEAWQQYTRGNRIRKSDQPWEQEKWNGFVSDSLKTAAAVQIQPNNRKPVFIVGMLRAGTTLLEQRLDRHPLITGRGELNFLGHMAGLFPDISKISEADKKDIAHELWTQMRLQGPQEAVYIDKNPLNFRFVNFLFAVMPEAKVIHIHRDGRDSCLSCFFQLFQHADANFSNDLNHLVDYYRGYRQLMTHWRTRFPGRIHDITYADLVESSEPTLAGVLDFIGADWNEAVLETGGQSRAVRTASAWQARQPLYRRSLGRWENYYEQAPDFFDAIARIDQAPVRRLNPLP
jgi:tetratricopeptide (TPR) repeat protein